jgi:hypothetical protein
VFFIASAKAVLQERFTVAPISTPRVDSDERQVPMGPCWSVLLRLLEERANFSLPLVGNALCKDYFDRPCVTVNAWRQPERDRHSVTSTLCCSFPERIRSERFEHSRHMEQILMRICIHPARNGISCKGQNKRGDGMVYFKMACNRDDSWD